MLMAAYLVHIICCCQQVQAQVPHGDVAGDWDLKGIKALGLVVWDCILCRLQGWHMQASDQGEKPQGVRAQAQINAMLTTQGSCKSR
jgi:hypothetical protein